jgi:ketosteroid isomerase-like protein
VAVSFIKPDVAISDSEWKLTGLPAEAPPLPTAGHSTVVVVKQGDAWKIAAHRARVPQPIGQ